MPSLMSRFIYLIGMSTLPVGALTNMDAVEPGVLQDSSSTRGSPTTRENGCSDGGATNCPRDS